MTPKEKADEIFNKMSLACDDIDCHHSLVPFIKECALIATDEMLGDIGGYLGDLNPKRFYWQQVKEELNKID